MLQALIINRHKVNAFFNNLREMELYLATSGTLTKLGVQQVISNFIFVNQQSLV